MRTRVLCFILTIITISFGKAQNWASVGSGITGMGINTTWTLYSSDSLMFAGGWFNIAGGTTANAIAQWNGVNWDSLASGTNGYLNAMALYKGELYVGGNFDSIGGVAANNIARWNGTRWMQVDGGIKGGEYGVCALAVYNGVLYVGGSFDSAGGKAIYSIAQWNDTDWSALGYGIYPMDEDDGVFAITSYEGGLYVAGDFGSSVGTNIAEWKGSAWSGLWGGVTGPIYSLAVYDNKLYAGGMLTQAGGIQANCIASWNTITWTSPDSGIWGESGYASVNALTVYNGELYAGGFFDTVNGQRINCITKWNGTKWSPVGSGINIGGDIDAMTVFDNLLYAGGGFDSAGGVYAKNIAMWTAPSAINEISMPNKVTVYPNPANNILSIKIRYSENVMIYTIYNEFGQQVKAGKLNSSKITKIDLDDLSSGIYMVEVSDSNEHYNTKFIKY